MRNKRILAFIIDMMAAVAFSLLINSILCYFNVKFIVAMVAIIGWAVLIGKDCLNGMSVGKRFVGIQVIDTNSRQIASPQKCVIRNLFYFVGPIDILFMLTNSKGLRLGDKVVHTEVVLRNKSLPKVVFSKVILAIGYVLLGLVIMEIIYYFRASSFGLL